MVNKSPKIKTAEQVKFEQLLQKILLTEAERKAIGYDYLSEYKEELDDFLFTQYKKTRQQVLDEIEKMSTIKKDKWTSESPVIEIRQIFEKDWQQYRKGRQW